jgi:hypothetical protein
MDKPSNIARMYREMLRDICVNYHPSRELDEQDSEFYEYIRSAYLDVKEKGSGIEVFLFASGLLTFGHIEVVEDILDNIPEGKGHVRRLAYTVTTLLPAPKELDVFENTEAIKNWFHENQDKLHWNSQQERFLAK